MVTHTTMYTCRFMLDAGEQKLLDLTWEVRRRGNCFHPGQDTLARWLNRTPRQVRRYLSHLREIKLLFWKQRGKKLTNVYYLGAELWRILTKGRKIPGAPKPATDKGPLTRDEARARLHELVAALPGGG